jgi:hypothetical protein
MAVLKALPAFAAIIPLLSPALAGSIADLEHVVLFMQGQLPHSLHHHHHHH